MSRLGTKGVASVAGVLALGAVVGGLLSAGAERSEHSAAVVLRVELPMELGGGARGAGEAGAWGEVRYGRDVRPILSDRCFLCHGPDAGKRAADLRLDVRESAVLWRGAGQGAWAAIVPGDAEASEVWRRISSHDADEQMPPTGSGKALLSDEQRATVRAWIDGGAVYEEHWAFVSPARVDVPRVEGAGAAWVRNPIDHFVLEGLHGAGLEPSGEADRATLLRRVFFDLTGLPPTVEELDSFLADESPMAYERWVDRLLSEEPYVTRYAERMATPWLDQARYADTSGIHMDAGRSIWLWRDWVLAAYRQNKPFDDFVVEQLAGDLIPDATTQQVVATGFNRNHVTSDEGGAIDEELRVEYAVDRVSTTGSVFLGLTLGCARCHDHKYDPVSQEEFYGLMALFNSIEEPGLYSQVPDNKRALEPFLMVPTAAQATELERLGAVLASLQMEMGAVTPEEETGRREFVEGTAQRLGVEWERLGVIAAESEGGATMAAQEDGSVLVSGTSPAQDVHTLTLRMEGATRNAILLEALADPSLGMGRVGRNGNGNAVLTGITARVESIADPTLPAQEVELVWAWANVEQQDGDFAVVNALETSADRAGDEDGWAVDAHRIAGNRVALFVAGEAFGFEGGSRVTVRLEYRSVYANHVLGRVRVSAGTVGDGALAELPEARGTWHLAGPFGVAERAEAFSREFGPGRDAVIDPDARFEDGLGRAAGVEADVRRWEYAGGVRDGVVTALESPIGAIYVGRRIFSPTARRITMSLGSDDGLRVLVNGEEVLAREVDRGVNADQDRIEVGLRAGMNSVVLKVSNTGGPAGMYWSLVRPSASGGSGASQIMDGVLAAAVLPGWARWADLDEQVGTAWLESFSPRRRELAERVHEAESEVSTLRAMVAVTMVMKESAEPRPTFVLTRGQYDMADASRPVSRGVPRVLGRIQPVAGGVGGEEPRALNRLDFAKWLVSAEDPLVARVTVNRLWAQVFGQGIVRTTEDLGLQGDWPSHPELLDWLAVRFREDGWDVRAMMRLLVTSATYRQASRVNSEAVGIDPGNRLLAYFPRQRLTGEQIRDQALYVSGLLVERLGGPSVKPYQPAGLWEEVAMPQSNTRVFERGMGEDLWRRSLYTYWKRASPPPNMLAFDAPTRESCVVRRGTTSTPLQALALWNDEQMVEAGRVLAGRVLMDRRMDPTVVDEERLALLVRMCTGDVPGRAMVEELKGALGYFRERYAARPEDARTLLEVGEAMVPGELDPGELAAWSMVAGAVLSSDAAVTRD